MIYKFIYDGTFKGRILTLINIICGILFPILIAGGITSVFIQDNTENEVIFVIVFLVLFIPSIIGYWHVVDKIKNFIEKDKPQKDISINKLQKLKKE